ncbi:MAG: RidA family protein [Bacteriovoracia bacterium]
MKKQKIFTREAPEPIGPYSQAIKAGGFLFCSGQIPLNPKTNRIEVTDVAAQAKVVMENLGAVLKAAGADYTHIVKTTIFLQDMADFPKVNEVYGKYFDEIPPARSTVQVAKLPKDALVEVEAIVALT